MRGFVICLVLVTLSVSVSNTQTSVLPYNREAKIFVITLDGFRWEELFGGADSALIHDPEATPDAGESMARFWDEDPEERRKKLLPFFWSEVEGKGQLYGNRLFGNKVNVSNPYALSYPGYSELLTGIVDLSIYNNSKVVNPNPNVLDQLNSTKEFRGKVAAFTFWDVFPYILNQDENYIVLNSGNGKTKAELNPVAGSLYPAAAVPDDKAETRDDDQTFAACRDYLLTRKPSVVFLGFSGTDDAGHDARYDRYLAQAHSADRMIGELWNLVQSLPEYAGKTTFLITTDHGRGDGKTNWSRHGFFVSGSSQTWFALLGRNVVPAGEMRVESQAFQKELKGLITSMLQR